MSRPFADTIGQRGEQIKQLLANANKVARVLGDRSEQVNGLLVNANTLLAAFRQRSQALSILLSNVSEVSTQVSGLIKENPNLNHVLRQLGTVSDELVKRKKDLCRCAGTAQQVYRVPDGGRRFRAVLQGDRGESASLPDPSAVG